MTACNYCGDETDLVPDKKFCFSCEEKMYRECVRCHLPYNNQYYFLNDKNRCNKCQKIYLKEKEKRKLSKENFKKSDIFDLKIDKKKLGSNNKTSEKKFEPLSDESEEELSPTLKEKSAFKRSNIKKNQSQNTKRNTTEDKNNQKRKHYFSDSEDEFPSLKTKKNKSKVKNKNKEISKSQTSKNRLSITNSDESDNQSSESSFKNKKNISKSKFSTKVNSPPQKKLRSTDVTRISN